MYDEEEIEDICEHCLRNQAEYISDEYEELVTAAQDASKYLLGLQMLDRQTVGLALEKALLKVLTL